MTEKWKDEFHKKLDSYETTPPEGLFDSIISSLPPAEGEDSAVARPAVTPATASSTNRTNRGHAIIWTTFFLSAAAIGIFLWISSSIVDINSNMSSTAVSLAKMSKSKPGTGTGKGPLPIPGTQQITRNNTGSHLAEHTGHYNPAPARTALSTITSAILPQRQDNGTTVAMAETAVTDTEAENTAGTQTQTAISTETYPSQGKERTGENKRHHFPAATAGNHAPRHDRHTQLGIYLAGMPVTASSSSNSPAIPTATGNLTGIVVTGHDRTVKKAHHHQPITLGVSIAFPVSRKISVETGLTYSHHYSELTYESNKARQEVSQQLNFVGIPLQVNYRLWQKNNFVLYTSGGGSVEKMVYGKQKEQGNSTEGNVTRKVSMKELQWALSARLGAAYRLTEGISLYFEPGISYHFGTQTELQTVYGDHPTSLQLKAGLRLNLQ